MRPAPITLLVSFVLLVPPVSAQQDPARNVTPLLLPRLGHHHHAISTKNPEAQKYFDQGLLLVYGFNRAEAVYSFRRASQLDLQAAMPHWGALAYGRHMNMDVDMDVQNSAAYKEVQRALALTPGASEEERLYIRALAQRSSSDDHADGQKLELAYAQAMTDLARRYPDDLDALAMSLEARMMAHRYEWFHHDMAQQDTQEIIRDIEGLLRRDPDHPLGNHLYIHILDTAHPEMALGVAYRIPQIAPGLGHLVHMAGHIFYNLGDYEMTARVNEQAAAAEREYVNLVHPGKNIYTIFYYLHDISLHFSGPRRAGPFH